MILTKTQSICPVCNRPVDAYYIEENDHIYFVKTCPEHGSFKTTVSESAEDYMQWVSNPVVNIPPKVPVTGGDPEDKSCPLHCGTCSNHLQTACCVLIDITDRCNQHCPYCFAKSEMDTDRSGEPTLEQIEAKYDLLLELGEERPFNIQLSGGEPTVRDDLPDIIRLGREKGFCYIQINSNGRRLALEDDYARILKEAGASVIFMQFDGTRDDIYEALRGEPLLDIKKQAIRNCEKAGLPVTLVPTVVEGVNTDNIGEMMDFVLENVNVVKGIHFQPVSFFGRHPQQAEHSVNTGKVCPDHVQGGKEKAGVMPTGGSMTTGGSVAADGDSVPDDGIIIKAGTESEPAPEEETCAADSADSIYTGDFPGRVTMFGLLRRLEAQRTDFKYGHYCPISTGHTLCCFYSTYIREPDGSARCTLTDARRKSGVSCCDASQVDRSEVIRKDRDFVLNKWEIAPPEEAEERRSTPKYKSSLEITDFDEFLSYYRQNTFTVTGMAFQDSFNLDAERVKRCRVQVLSEDDRLIPFCAYNSIYRK